MGDRAGSSPVTRTFHSKMKGLERFSWMGKALFCCFDISFSINGHKLHTSLEEIKQREDLFNQILLSNRI